MREMPIIFTPEMVRAILDHGKTQTRRILNPQPIHAQHHVWRGKVVRDAEHRMWCWKDVVLDNIWDFPAGEDRRELASHCPYGVPGDRLWVREKWTGTWLDKGIEDDILMHVVYAADGSEAKIWAPNSYTLPKAAVKPENWVTPLFMPRWASRITLEITEVRAQRLKEISAADALAEGSYLDRCPCMPRARDRAPIHAAFHQGDCHIHGTEFSALWKRIHGSWAWDTPTFVWAITFRRLP